MLTPIVSALTSTLPSPGTGVGTSTIRAPPGRRGGAAGSPSCLGDNRVAQHADAAVDLDLDDIARLHPQGRLAGKADPLRRTGRDPSPATSGVQSEQYEIRVGMSKIRSSIPVCLVCWTSLPLSRVIRWSR